MSESKGLEFKKIDLHVHTPYSSGDYEDKGVSAEDIVGKALGENLAAIAITDHQTGANIDAIKLAAADTELVIFPGVEILASGGERGVHVIILFDVDKDTEYVNQFLHQLRIYHREGEKFLATEYTVGQIADELEKYNKTALLILAHCHSSKGVSGDIKGETRKLIFEDKRKCILGAEANESDFLNDEKKVAGTRVIDCFNGSDPNYGNKKIGVYQASDAHCLEDIGSSFTYFKVDDPITIEDIRQCLIDRDTRIRQSFEYEETKYPFVESIKITSGFLKNQVINLNHGLNSLLGAKGAGKSLVIELLRFGLSQASENKDIKKDHDLKLEKCLQLHGEVEIVFDDGSGKKFKVVRGYNPSEGNPIEIFDATDGSKKNIDIEKLFPVLFISQNEIVKIAEDDTKESQRKFIDRFFNFKQFQENIETKKKQLSEIDDKVTVSIISKIKASKIEKKIATHNEEISKLGRQIKNQVFDEYSNQEKIGREIKKQELFLIELRSNLKISKAEYTDLSSPTADEEIDVDPAVKRSVDATEKVIEGIEDYLKKALELLDKQVSLIRKEFGNWESSFEEVKKRYEETVKKTGGNQLLLDDNRKKLLVELSGFEKDLAFHKSRSQHLEKRLEQREKAVDELEKAYKEYFEERQSRCEHFTQNSIGSLKVEIENATDTTSFYENLIGLKKGSYLKDDFIKKITGKISPNELINLIINYELSGRSDKSDIEKISDDKNLDKLEVERLISHLLDGNSYEEILGLLYNSVPEDTPTISYKVGDKYKSLDALSVGQKAVALLIIALSDGEFPIIIDQPEDSLDLRSIWDNVCKKLRDTKERRQFIFTTHNSSVAVASDSDKFVILEGGASFGKVLHSGSISQSPIKKEVIGYLEGGETTYRQKRRKYNL